MVASEGSSGNLQESVGFMFQKTGGFCGFSCNSCSYFIVDQRGKPVHPHCCLWSETTLTKKVVFQNTNLEFRLVFSKGYRLSDTQD